MRQPRLRTVLIGTGAALALVAGGTAAYAVTSGPIDSSGVIHGCYTNTATNGSHKVVLQNVGTSCPNGTTAIKWNQKGPAGPHGPQGIQGAPGPQGPQGIQGPPGLSLFARVDNTGVLHQHSAGVTETKDPSFTGLYHVFFPQDISNCAVVVSQGESSNNGFLPGTFYLAVVQSDPNNDGNPHEVNVYPTDTSGTPKDAGFDLIVAC